MAEPENTSGAQSAPLTDDMGTEVDVVPVSSVGEGEDGEVYDHLAPRDPGAPSAPPVFGADEPGPLPEPVYSSRPPEFGPGAPIPAAAPPGIGDEPTRIIPPLDRVDSPPPLAPPLAYAEDDRDEEPARDGFGRFAGLLALLISLFCLAWILGLIPFASVGPSQLKNGAVSDAKVAPHSLTSRSLQGSQVGPQGPQGLQGKTGKSGAPGKNGRNGINGQPGLVAIRYVQQSAPASAQQKSVQVSCANNEVVLGGGATVQGTGGALTSSDRTGNGWRASAVPLPTYKSNFSLSVTASCGTLDSQSLKASNGR